MSSKVLVLVGLAVRGDGHVIAAAVLCHGFYEMMDYGSALCQSGMSSIRQPIAS